MVSSGTDEIIQISGLSVRSEEKLLLEDIDFFVRTGEIRAVIGESGSGKTTLVHFLLGLVNETLYTVWTSFRLFGEILDSDTSSIKWTEFRGKRISLIPQNPGSGFHPYRTVASQVLEYFSLLNPGYANREACLQLFRSVGLSDPESVWLSYPHQLSGGEKQRILVLLSVYSGAELILADEPTSALDPITGAGILTLLTKLVRENDRSLVFISHDLGSVTDFADIITVLKGGRIAETLIHENRLWSPKTEYARKLFEIDSSLPYTA
ncbi:ABC transporter, ATP-binding protein [Leptospira inadai serovar Lyme str. 10]|uniref:ABC transporter, ATP-binding protein n=2 Tax=Leptospira inadai serovar Lyme TaxID=293084 RepID=V6HBR9_9LEPT|nr:ATP-binding cassette domain-containing protein [Leptospira inadai]EQA37166.1 ABC transporter, ATP-binding protein [Leptospira inadai serovar Lyme str. 10]PNV76566.1 ABC transporter ATP-binding protein [Leptospira inadai serovar Lyme]